MYTRKKLLREEIFKSNSDKNPSFSSSLLDEIYRSIDEKEEINQVQKAEKIGKKYVRNEVEDEEMAGLRRALLVEKWMDKKVEEKNFSRRPPLIPDFEKDQLQQDNDPMFFSSTSTSSVSSSGVLSSSSDTEYFAAVEKTRTSCFFGASWPKPIRTKVPVSVPQEEKTEDCLKSKLEALKIYDNLKNLKQPISPGARLTNFISLFFTNESSKKNHNNSKSGNKASVHAGSEEYPGRLKSKSAQTSAGSSATSFSRSILSKSPSTTTSKGKLNQEISKRKVSFNPVSVIVDEDCRPFGHKCIDEKGSKSNGMKMEDSKVYQNQKKDDFVVERERSDGEDDDEDEEEEGSECSSELFEIDHLVLFGKKRFCEELPVYETTDLGKNLAIARGLMR